MPFKPKADPEDYPEHYQNRPRHWVTEHQEENMKEAIGSEVWAYLEQLENARKGKTGGNKMSDLYREIIAYSVLALFVLTTVILCHNQTMETGSIDKVIEARVIQEFQERYRNLPRIAIEKVYTLQANGNEIVMDTVGKE